MSNLEQFKINLKSLAEGMSVINLDLDNAYFEAIDAPVVRQGNLKCTLAINCIDSVFDMDFHIEGSVTLPCDICLDDMEQEVLSDNHLVAKLGDDYSEEDDEVTVPENEGILNVAWFIYQFIEFDIPLRHVHAPGKCNPAMMKVLQEHSAVRSGDGDGDQAMDSRWEALRNIEIKE